MDKFFVDKGGEAEEYFQGRRHVRFPVCLALRVGSGEPLECPDFVLNAETAEVMVRTSGRFPLHSAVALHFYIPPESKLLAGVKGRVIGKSSSGIRIRIGKGFGEEMRRLEGYLEERRRLMDRRI
jgi:hypothetical protein